MCCYWPLVLLTRSVGRYPRGEGLDPPGVTALAEHVIVQGIAAPALLLAAQQEVTVHTPVAVHVEAPVQGHHPDRLLLALGGHDRLPAHRAPRGEPPVEVLDAVDLVTGVHSEGDPVQALVADDAGEAVRVIWFAWTQSLVRRSC